MDDKANGVDTSALLVRRVEELQHERDEKQHALEVLVRRVEGLQYEMDEKADIVEVLTQRVEELQRERGELRKDIEQLCMQQSGPGYISVATRMLSQRTAALEQDIENLQKKLVGCLRENQNLQDELAEAYRVKTQLADLYGAELSKNKELEKQIRFFQSSVAQAFAERDKSLLECEKAKEREEAALKKFADIEERARQYQSTIDDKKRMNDALQMEVTELRAHTESSLKVVLKFYEVRCRDCEYSSNITFEDKCSTLLNDSADNWTFSSDGETSTSKYIASLEEENESLKTKIAKLQSNLRMGLEIEQQLQRNARILDKRQALYGDLMKNGLSTLQKFHTHQRAEIMKILEEESSQLSSVVNEIQSKLNQISVSAEVIGKPVGEMQCCDGSCKDVHVTTDTRPGIIPEGDVPAGYSAIFDDSKALAQTLQEKMEALMLFSQEQERYLLENHRNQAIIEDLQKSLSQVKDEKVKVLMELAKVKEEYLLLKSSAAKDGHSDPPKIIAGHEQRGMLKTILKRTSLKSWIRKESSNIGHESSDGSDHTVRDEYSSELARLKVENSTLLESVATMERLASSVHRLHIVLMKAYDDVKSARSLENTYEALNSLITEANLMKTALTVVLPVSWSGDSSCAITTDALYDPCDSPKSSKSEKVELLSSAGMEMVELLILAADILKESFMLKK